MLRGSIASILASLAIGLIGFTSFTTAGAVVHLNNLNPEAWVHDDSYDAQIHVIFRHGLLIFNHPFPTTVPVWIESPRIGGNVYQIGPHNHEVSVGPEGAHASLQPPQFGDLAPAPNR